MKKINKKELRKITIKLKPHWEKFQKLRFEHFNKIMLLQKEMNKKMNLKTKLEFFYCDGECVGIGAEDYSERKYFPLIHDSELG